MNNNVRTAVGECWARCMKSLCSADKQLGCRSDKLVLHCYLHRYRLEDYKTLRAVGKANEVVHIVGGYKLCSIESASVNTAASGTLMSPTIHGKRYGSGLIAESYQQKIESVSSLD